MKKGSSIKLRLQDTRQDGRAKDVESRMSLEFAEAALAQSLADLGPFVAIGRPGERLPPLGASRLYVRDNWQHAVSQLVADSRLVVLRIGRSEGYIWEIEHLLKNCDPRKVIVYMPPRDHGPLYDQWCKRMAEFFPHLMPKNLGRGFFISFGPEWTPRVVGNLPNERSSRAWWRIWVSGPAPQLRVALNAGGRPTGVRTRRLPFLGSEWVIYGGVVVLWAQLLLNMRIDW
jgi:hypothetical protein